MAQSLTWNNPGTGDWNTGTNWSPADVPATGDTAVIDAGTAQLVSGVNAADGITLQLGGMEITQGTVDAVLQTQGTNVTFGSGFLIADTAPGAVGALETSGFTTFAGTLDVGAAGNTGSGDTFLIGVDSYDSGDISGVFENLGVISVTGGGALAIANLGPETPYSSGGKREIAEQASGAASIGGGTVQFDTGTIMLDDGNLVGLGQVPLEGPGLISMENKSEAVLTDATSQTEIYFADGSDTVGIVLSPGFITDYSMSAYMQNFQSGDAIILQGATIGSLTYSGTEQDLEVEDASGNLIALLNIAGTYTSSSFAFTNVAGTSDSTASGIITIACFSSGTHIATPEGERAVECLAEGDLVVTAAGRVAPVRWIGHRRIDCRRHPEPDKVRPVRVRAGAFGDGLPRRDLLLSPDHGVYAEGVLIPVKHLVNGVSIVPEQTASVRYFHVEIDRHDVVLAEGLPAESYLDTGNRAQFANGGGFIALHPDFSPLCRNDGCVPLCVAGAPLERTRARLLQRVASFGFRPVKQFDAAVRVANRVLRPASVSGALCRFLLPPGTRMLTILSSSGSPSWFDPANEDERRLGLAIAAIVANDRVIRLEGAGPQAGFHAPEQSATGCFRWTDGAGQLTLPDLAQRPVVLDLLLRDASPSWRLEAADQRGKELALTG